MKIISDIFELDKNFPSLFSPLDRQFAEFMQKLSGGVSPGLVMAARILSSRTAEGNVCLDISGIAGKNISDVMNKDADFKLYSAGEWLITLKDSPVVEHPLNSNP